MQANAVSRKSGILEQPYCDLKVQEPFRLDLTAWALRRRANNTMDRWVDNSWRRTLTVENRTIEVVVNQKAEDSSSVQVQVVGSRLTDRQTGLLFIEVEKCLGLSKDLTDFYQFAREDNVLDALAQRFLGLKPPRFPTVFEAVVNGIACQQLSLDIGITLLNRLSENYGRNVTAQGFSARAFPCPEDLAGLTPDDFRKLGYPRQKGRAIIELSQRIVSGELDLECIENVSNPEALAQLCGLRGVGRWTGEYVLLRGLGRIDVFPVDDVGGRRGLQRLLGIGEALDYSGTKALADRWYPYSGFVYFHLLMNRLVEEDCLQA